MQEKLTGVGDEKFVIAWGRRQLARTPEGNNNEEDE